MRDLVSFAVRFRHNPLGMKGHIAQRYGELVKDLWSGTAKAVAPLKFRVSHQRTAIRVLYLSVKFQSNMIILTLHVLNFLDGT